MSANVERFQRAANARILDRGARVLVIGRDGAVREFSDDSAELLREVLDFLQSPASRDEVVAHVATLSGEPDPAAVAGVVDELLSVLRKAGVVHSAAGNARENEFTPRGGRRVVLGVSAAVAAVDTPALVRVLQSRGHTVRVALTRSARKFTSPEALEALTHARVHRGIWHRSPESPVPHIELATWADAVLVAPASATTLSRIAHADCSDLVSAVVVATRAPVLVAPSMNPAMYASAPVKRVLALLREDGVAIAHPSYGVEVAQRPGERASVYGPALGAPALVDLLELLLARSGGAARVDWQSLHAGTPAERLPWYTDELDLDISTELDDLARRVPGARMLDVGTSVGTVAIAAAKRGLRVVATDVAPAAVSLASRRAGDLPVTWLVDDVTKSALWGPFDAVFDRGCLHTLGAAEQRAYGATLARVTRPGARWVVKVHHPEEPQETGTRKMSADDLRAIAGDAFDLVSVRESTLGGSPPRRALLATFERRS